MWSLNQSITHKFLSVEKNTMMKERFMLRNSAMLSCYLRWFLFENYFGVEAYL